MNLTTVGSDLPPSPLPPAMHWQRPAGNFCCLYRT